MTEAEFLAIYGDYPIAIGEDLKISLNFAVALEATHCPAPPEKRADEELRLQRLVRYVGHEALLPEHRWLVPQVSFETPK